MNSINFKHVEQNISTSSKVWNQEASTSKYTFLGVIYLISVVSSSIANSTNTDVQSFYRIPFVNTRWIDISILLVLSAYFYDIFSTKKN